VTAAWLVLPLGVLLLLVLLLLLLLLLLADGGGASSSYFPSLALFAHLADTNCELQHRLTDADTSFTHVVSLVNSPSWNRNLGG
jgi:hypothetical protein